ncbi:MAG: hypothetical protein FJX74_18125, partial [Armatimonadetes bacterium]|nr:hypothetical protein [Armatimonadota bacterium]
GASRVDTTPPLHVPYLGFEPRQGTFEGVHDSLFARAAVFSRGDGHLAVVSVDALGLSRDLFGPGRDFVAEVRERAGAGTGLSRERILIAATHAHSTPETYGITRLWEREDCAAWIETLAEQLARAIQSAWADRRPAKLWHASTTLRGMARNRRRDDGPLDEELLVLLAERDDGGPVLLANFACHPVTVQVQPLVSADFPGAAMALVERELGPQTVALFLQGAAGDINPVRGHTSDWRDVETYGLMLGGATLEAVGAARLSEACTDPIIAARAETAMVEAREAPSVEEAAAGAAAAQEGTAEARAAREALRLAQFGQELIPAEVQCLRIGDLALAAFPGELFCALGQQVKRASPAPATMVVECANGCLGYLAPCDEWERGGYEVGLGAWCRVAAGGPERMTEAAERLAAPSWCASSMAAGAEGTPGSGRPRYRRIRRCSG